MNRPDLDLASALLQESSPDCLTEGGKLLSRAAHLQQAIALLQQVQKDATTGIQRYAQMEKVMAKVKANIVALKGKVSGDTLVPYDEMKRLMTKAVAPLYTAWPSYDRKSKFAKPAFDVYYGLHKVNSALFQGGKFSAERLMKAESDEPENDLTLGEGATVTDYYSGTGGVLEYADRAMGFLRSWVKSLEKVRKNAGAYLKALQAGAGNLERLRKGIQKDLDEINPNSQSPGYLINDFQRVLSGYDWAYKKYQNES